MPTKTRRLEWLDLFRGLAVLGMVWTHTAHTFLRDDLLGSAWFHTLDYYHGLIAPAFFWMSGYSRAHITKNGPKPALPALKRLGIVLLIGYALHVYWYSVPKLSPDEWREALKVDVLQCLAITGMLLLIVERCKRWHAAVAGGLLVAFVGLEQMAANWQTGWLPLDQYLNDEHGSLFPVFPWVGFGLAGYLTRVFWDGSACARGWMVMLGGAVLAFAPGLATLVTSSPAFFLQRLGWVMMAGVLLASTQGFAKQATGWLRLAGRESLLLYVAHLMMIHTIPLPQQPLQTLIGHTFSLAGAGGLALAVFGVCLLLGLVNEWRKQRAKAIQLSDSEQTAPKG